MGPRAAGKLARLDKLLGEDAPGAVGGDALRDHHLRGAPAAGEAAADEVQKAALAVEIKLRGNLERGEKRKRGMREWVQERVETKLGVLRRVTGSLIGVNGGQVSVRGHAPLCGTPRGRPPGRQTCQP